MAIGALMLILLSSSFIPEENPNSKTAKLPPMTYAEQYPLDSAVIFLGKKLFYDPILSRDSTISCASCHSPYSAFAHTDHRLSHGISDSIGTRNAPALFNLSWSKKLMWDGAVNHLEVQALAPIIHPSEMGNSLPEVIHRLRKHAIYPALFKTAFGEDTITGQYFLKALFVFQLSLTSLNSRYDKMSRGELEYSLQEKNGYRLYQINCASCHAEPLFTNFEFANNGLTIDSMLKDVGRYAITHKPSDSFVFKIPSLRNLKYTFPYMHDGRFLDLYAVLDHYSSLDHNAPYLSQTLKKPLSLTARDKTDLLVFLRSLDDESFVWNQKNIYRPTKNDSK